MCPLKVIYQAGYLIIKSENDHAPDLPFYPPSTHDTPMWSMEVSTVEGVILSDSRDSLTGIKLETLS